MWGVTANTISIITGLLNPPSPTCEIWAPTSDATRKNIHQTLLPSDHLHYSYKVFLYDCGEGGAVLRVPNARSKNKTHLEVSSAVILRARWDMLRLRSAPFEAS